jgi:hypothetical protein
MIDKLLFINEDNSYLFRGNIVEYDMQSASLAVSERFNLMSKTLLEQLRNTPKDERVKKVGLMQRDDKEFSDRMIQGIIDTRQEFLDINHISEDDILCLHSDAIVFDMKSDIIDHIDNVKFVRKGKWSSYMLYQGVEMYYGDGVIDFKGIPKQILKMHTLGIVQHLVKIFEYMEACDDSIIPYMKKFQKRYYEDRLPDYYYTSFPRVGTYKMDNLNLFAFLANVISSDMRSW